MAACPFCEGKVPDTLERLGGPCPHCFNEIPGEDAATDPGVALKAAQARKDALKEKKSQLRTVLLGGVALALLVGIGGYRGWQHLAHQGEVDALLSLEFQDYSLMPLGEIEALEKQLRDAEAAASNDEQRQKIAAQRVKVTAQRQKLQDAPEIKSKWDDLDPGDDTNPEVKSDPQTMPDVGIADLKLELGGGPDIGVVRGDSLKGSLKTNEVLASFLKAKQLELKRCHELALNEAPGTGGRWLLSVRMLEDGSLTNVRFTADGGSANADFESCVLTKARRWKLDVTTDSPVDYTQAYTFTARF